jgi:hypothetical protein
MYFTSIRGKDRDIWIAESMRPGLDKQIRRIQSAVDHNRELTTGRTAYGFGLLTFCFISVAFVVTSVLTSWPDSHRWLVPTTPLIAASIVFVAVGSLSVWAVVDRFKTTSMLKKIETTRSGYAGGIITAEYYSFQQLFHSNQWILYTNLGYCATPEIIDRYFHETLTADMVIRNGGQNVDTVKQGIDEAAKKAQAACTADAMNHQRSEAQALKNLDLTPPLIKNDVK